MTALGSVLDIFKYRRKETFLHSLDPRSKFLLLVVLSVASLALNDVFSLLLLLTIEIVLLAISKSLNEWIRSLRGLAMLLLMIFILNFLTLPSGRLFTSITMVLRFVCLTSAFSIFFLTTTADELANALEVSGVPREYSMMFTMSLRFVPSLAKDLQTVIDALRSRGLELEGGRIKERIKNYTHLLVPLIVYELRRSLMVAEALEARGFGAVKKVKPYVELRLRRRDYSIIFISLAGLFMLLWFILSGRYAMFTSAVRYLFPEF
ncbi:MAG: energy-coupling factor transporter transmembrane component T [Thermofilaceae archaeon]|nr:energy-coupling factor transporter transmembrane component T [Thermofilaceae archaeon]